VPGLGGLYGDDEAWQLCYDYDSSTLFNACSMLLYALGFP
jgi:hypothetical protein